MCGIYGLKPTYGLVSAHGVFPSAWSLDHVGPMARSVSDLALMLNYMAGYDSKDAASLKVPASDYTDHLNKEIKGIKIGIPTYYLEELDPDAKILFNYAIATLKSLGAEVKEVEIPELSMTTFIGYTTVTGEAAAFHYEMLRNRLQDYS